jgi:hypothetical protein
MKDANLPSTYPSVIEKEIYAFKLTMKVKHTYNSAIYIYIYENSNINLYKNNNVSLTYSCYYMILKYTFTSQLIIIFLYNFMI